ncbi:unnamed protein product, partial [Porites lobata]
MTALPYATINDAVKILQRLGTGSYLAKTDIKSAFRIIPVSPLDYPLLGIKWDSQYYFDSHDKCKADLSNFLSMCDFLGVPIAHEKTLGPLTTLQFAGIELDSVRQEARLPSEKIHKCRALLHQFAQKRSVTLRELQSLIGLLNFCCSVVTPGRAFL